MAAGRAPGRSLVGHRRYCDVDVGVQGMAVRLEMIIIPVDPREDDESAASTTKRNGQLLRATLVEEVPGPLPASGTGTGSAGFEPPPRQSTDQSIEQLG